MAARLEASAAVAALIVVERPPIFTVTVWEVLAAVLALLAVLLLALDVFALLTAVLLLGERASPNLLELLVLLFDELDELSDPS